MTDKSGGDGRIAYARELFDEGLSAEEWVARHAHEIGCWSLDEVAYPDAALAQWIAEVTKLLLAGPDVLKPLRRKYLTAEQIRQIENAANKF